MNVRVSTQTIVPPIATDLTGVQTVTNSAAIGAAFSTAVGIVPNNLSSDIDVIVIPGLACGAGTVTITSAPLASGNASGTVMVGDGKNASATGVINYTAASAGKAIHAHFNAADNITKNPFIFATVANASGTTPITVIMATDPNGVADID